MRMICRLNSCSAVPYSGNVARGVDFVLWVSFIFLSLLSCSPHCLANITQTNQACLRNRPAALPFLLPRPPSHVPRGRTKE